MNPSQPNQPDPIDDLFDQYQSLKSFKDNSPVAYGMDKAALNQLMLRERLAGAKQIVQSITKEHELVKKKNAITLAEQHGYFYAVRDASLEMRALAQLVEAGGRP